MAKKLISILLLLLLIFIITSCSNTMSPLVSVSGTIKDNENRNPIPKAVVSIGNKTIYTDNNGYFILNTNGNKTVNLKVEKGGYWKEEKPLFLRETNVNAGTTYLKNKAEFSARVSGKITIKNASTNIIQSKNLEKFTKIPLKTGDKNNQLDYVKGEILVKFKDSINPQNIVQNNNSQGTIMSLNNNKNIYKVKSDRNLNTEELYNYYNNLENVDKVSYNYIGYLMNIPDDEYYSYQWHYNEINILPIWNQNYIGSSSVTVAVIDTGYLPHGDLMGNIDTRYERDFTDNDYDAYDSDASKTDNIASHGTHVAGIIGAVGDNGKGVAGVNWNVNIMPIRIFDTYGNQQSFTTDRLINAIYYAVDNGASVINLSLAYVANRGDSDPDNYTFWMIEEALEYAHNSGVTVVAAAGNGLSNGFKQIGQDYVFYPASSKYTIAVGATDINNNRTYYSNYGEGLDVLAPGGDLNTCIHDDINPDGILSTHKFPNNRDEYSYMEGTSMAAPQISGVAALLVAQGIRNPDDIKQRIAWSSNNDLLNVETIFEETPDNHFYVDVKIFAAYLDGEYYHQLSNITGADYEGYYDLTYVKPEHNLRIIAWIDENNDNEINKGEYFGTSKELYLYNNDVENDVDITLTPFQPGQITSLNNDKIQQLNQLLNK